VNDYNNGSTEFLELRAKGEKHPIEAVGRKLRSMMSWVSGDDKDYVEGSAQR
jgi:ketol-acid reductoisomerase